MTNLGNGPKKILNKLLIDIDFLFLIERVLNKSKHQISKKEIHLPKDFKCSYRFKLGDKKISMYDAINDRYTYVPSVCSWR